MDRSLTYKNGVWSVPNLRPTRAQTAASAYRPPRIRTSSLERPSTQSAIENGFSSSSGSSRRGVLRGRDITSSMYQPQQSSLAHGSSQHPLQTSGSYSNSNGITPHSSMSSSIGLNLTEENIMLREKVQHLSRSLLKSQQQSATLLNAAQRRKNRSKIIKIKTQTQAFDPASNSHPSVFGIVEPNEVWRPSVAPRPLSPIRQFSKIEGLAASPIRKSSQKKRSSWSLGREFQPKEVEHFEMDKHLLTEWLSSYNNEQRTYRSLSTQIETELHEASVFSRQLPAPNMLMTAVACASLDRMGTLFGRYKPLLGSIRQLLMQAIFEDADELLKAEAETGISSTVEQFCSYEPYYAALNRHQIQLADVQQNFESLRTSLTEHKGNAKKRRSTMVAEMWKNAAVKSSAKMAKDTLSKQLKQAEDSLSNLHNSIHIDTHNSIIKMLDKLNASEAASVLASLMPLVGKHELGTALVQAMRQRQNFSSGDVLHIIMDLANTLDKVEKSALFPAAGKAFPNSLVHAGVLQLLKEMSTKNRDALIGELYGGDSEAILNLLRQLTETDGGDLVSLMGKLVQMLVGDNVEDILRLCGGLMDHAVGASGKGAGHVMKQMFQHLPDELEHAVHHQAHNRRQETGVILPHEIEAAASVAKAKEHAAIVAAAEAKIKTGVTIETQTDDPNNMFGKLDKDTIWGGTLPGHGDNGGDRGSKENSNIVELTHWYEDLMMLSQKSRYKTIAHMNRTKALNLVYDTYVRKIVKNKVDDRNGSMRESMGSFLRNSFKKLYGIPRVVNENLVGVVQSIELFASSSRRIRIFGELCGRHQKEHISDRLSDVYLHMLTLAWPKFNKQILRKGEVFINSTQIRKVMMSIFPKRTVSNAVKIKRSKKRHHKDFYIGKTLLSTEVREELYETVARTVFEEKGVTWVDFDVFSQVVLESWKRQVDIHCEMFDMIFDKYCDNQVERERRDSMVGEEDIKEELAAEMRPPTPKTGLAKVMGKGVFGGLNLMQAAASAKAVQQTDLAIAEAAVKAAEDAKEHVMTREAFQDAVAHCIPHSATPELFGEMWTYLEPHRMSLGDRTHITAEHFSLVLTHWGIMPPADTLQLYVHQAADAADANDAADGETVPSTGDAGKADSETQKSSLLQLFGSLGVAMRLKKIAARIHNDLVELPHFSVLCQTGQTAKVQDAIDSADVNETSDRGSTPLMHATWFGHIEVIQLLLDSGANINMQNKRGNTALHFAYENSHKKITVLLREQGAVDLRNNIGILPIKLAKKLDRRNSVILQDMENINWEDEENSITLENSLENLVTDDVTDATDATVTTDATDATTNAIDAKENEV